MAKTTFVMAFLAVFAACAVAAPGCTNVTQVQTGKLLTQTPKGCLSSPSATEQIGSFVDIGCFDSVDMHVQNQTGAACKPGPLFFNVTFVNKTDACLAGVEVASGLMTTATSGPNTLKGTLTTAQEFTGTSAADGTFTVSVAGIDCKLTYNTTSTNSTKLPAANATANATSRDVVVDTNTTGAAAPAPATTAKSSAFAAAPAVMLALLSSALVLAL